MKRSYNFFMIGRRVDKEKFTGQVVWVNGTIRVEGKEEKEIENLLKENIEKVLELTHPHFHWRDVSLIEADTNGTKGIQIQDLERWEWTRADWEVFGFMECPYTKEEVQKFNSELAES